MGDTETRGQRHDRIDGAVHKETYDGPPARYYAPPVRASEKPADISAMQRMLSATSGSILTSLLGMHREPQHDGNTTC